MMMYCFVRLQNTVVTPFCVGRSPYIVGVWPSVFSRKVSPVNWAAVPTQRCAVTPTQHCASRVDFNARRGKGKSCGQNLCQFCMKKDLLSDRNNIGIYRYNHLQSTSTNKCNNNSTNNRTLLRTRMPWMHVSTDDVPPGGCPLLMVWMGLAL